LIRENRGHSYCRRLMNYLPKKIWELNIRQATVLGIAGAGGAGFKLITCMPFLQYKDLLTILIMISVMVTLVDTVSSRIRDRII